MSDDRETGIGEKGWLEKRIELHFIQHGAFPQGLCLEYEQKFGVQAEKNLINALASQGA